MTLGQSQGYQVHKIFKTHDNWENWICNEKPFISKSSFAVKEGITDRGYSTDCSSNRLFMHCIGITVQHNLIITINVPRFCKRTVPT